jgi:hypothetical protein
LVYNTATPRDERDEQFISRIWTEFAVDRVAA